MRAPFEQRVIAPGSLRAYRAFTWLTILWLAVIYAFSAQPMAVSAEQSGWLAGLIANLTGWQMDQLLLRKLAHLVEYALLGLLAGLALSQTAWRPRHALGLLVAGLMAAFLDESIQLLSGRGPAIVDVWIDTAGVAIGLFIALGLSKLRRKITSK